jgi:hypothetical protein
VVNVTLPEYISEETQLVLGGLVRAQEAMVKAQGWLDTAREDRDHGIAQLRTHGWTIRQIQTFTGLSVAALEKICKKQGVVATRGARIQAPTAVNT